MNTKTEPLTDSELAELDQNIRNVVRWLRKHGFETTDSGDGLSKTAAAEQARIALASAPHDEVLLEHRVRLRDLAAESLGCAHVFMQVDAHAMVEEANRLFELLTGELCIEFEQMPQSDEDLERLPHIQASYDPVSGVGILELYYFTDEDLDEASYSLKAMA